MTQPTRLFPSLTKIVPSHLLERNRILLHPMLHELQRLSPIFLCISLLFGHWAHAQNSAPSTSSTTSDSTILSAPISAADTNVSPANAIPARAFVTGSPSISSSRSTLSWEQSLLPKKRRHKHKSKSLTSLSPFKNLDKKSTPEIEMYAGESRVFPIPGVARIAVGNGQIMSAAALDNKEVLVFANAVGTSSLFVWTADGRYQHVKIHIISGDTSRVATEIAAFLSSMPNAKTSIIGDKVVVEGDNLTDLDLAKIEELSKRYPQIVNFTNRLGWEQMVLLDVKVVEFPTKELHEIGLKWNATGGAAIGGIWSPIHRGTDGPYQINIQTTSSGTNATPITDPTGGTLNVPSGLNALSAVNMGLNAQLNLLSQEGKAAILAEPQLSARNGAKASFLAGGEYPYTVSNTNGQTVIFKPYGIKLDIQPHVDPNGTIRATIDSEVSSIDGSLSTPAGPALLSRKTTTEFNVKNGETIVLSGLLSSSSHHDVDKVPFLGDLPVLGALFRSKRYQNDETELVVFVTPSVIDSHTPEMVDRIHQTTERLQKEKGGKPAFLPPITSSPVSKAPQPIEKPVIHVSMADDTEPSSHNTATPQSTDEDKAAQPQHPTPTPYKATKTAAKPKHLSKKARHLQSQKTKAKSKTPISDDSIATDTASKSASQLKLAAIPEMPTFAPVPTPPDIDTFPQVIQ